MTGPEYIQLKAFARIDGALLSLLWTVSFACYIIGLTHQGISLLAMILALITPFFVAKRLKSFRDVVREGIISFMRSWIYVVFVFFYGSLLFSLIVYAYFAFLDHGYVLHVIQQMMETPEMAQVLKEYQMEDTMALMMQDMGLVRPIDIAVNLLTTNIMVGMVLGFPIAALLSSSVRKVKK